YALGEIEAATDPDGAADLFRRAAVEAGRIRADHVHLVARLALLAVLVRHDVDGDAPELAARGPGEAHRAGAWPQIWTSLRIVVELLAAHDRAHDAALVLCAAAHSPSAPPLVGDDVARYASLAAGLRRRVGSEAMAKLDSLAAG